MYKKLERLYGSEAEVVGHEIRHLINSYKEKIGPVDHQRRLSEKDSILITYADSIYEDEVKSFKTLKIFMEKYLGKAFSGVHILPFFPFSSDDGFSVIDYLGVNPIYGKWEDVDALGTNYDLMFDAVINHISQFSEWYQGYKAGDEAYAGFFIECDPSEDYSRVVRPRALPLLTPVEVQGEKKYVWTTFSEDQIDLNYSNPKVLIKVLEVLLEYVGHGAKLIRLDAVGFLWKTLGTSCIHLTETHTLVQVMKEVLLEVRGDITIITETNVPHVENISYFGNGSNEADLVYQFPLPPLTMHALLTGDSRKLLKWVDELEPLSETTTFFNFLSSHDGIGLRPVENTLDQEDIQVMLDAVVRNSGKVNYKNNSDGSQSPYELNINYMDALALEDDTLELHIKRFLAAQAILYSMKGVPGVYIHSLLGSGNDLQGLLESGINRRINREKLEFNGLQEALKVDGRRKAVTEANLHMLVVRKEEPSFNPYGRQEALFIHDGIFALKRYGKDEALITVIINLNANVIEIEVENKGVELLSGRRINQGELVVQPYEVLWIKS